VDNEPPEVLDIAKRLEHFPMELGRQIDLALGSVAEPEPNGVSRDVSRASGSRKHGSHSKGSIRGSGRLLSQPFTVAQNFTGQPGKYVSLKDTIKGFKMIVEGECDSLPEQAFYMVGQIEEAFEKAKTLQ
jgi:hypothetical protein